MLHIMQPSQGRTVIVRGRLAESNGAPTAPAVVTRVWGQNTDGSWTVNLTVFPDAAPPLTLGSVRLYADETAASEHIGSVGALVAYWPAKV